MKIYGVLCALSCWVLSSGAEEAPIDIGHLRVVEDHTENLANELHKFSVAVRDGKVDEMAAYFAGDLKVERLPVADGQWQQVAKWIYELPMERRQQYTDKVGFLADWQRFLAECALRSNTRILKWQRQPMPKLKSTSLSSVAI